MTNTERQQVIDDTIKALEGQFQNPFVIHFTKHLREGKGFEGITPHPLFILQNLYASSLGYPDHSIGWDEAQTRFEEASGQLDNY